jgi:hypothetical protein
LIDHTTGAPGWREGGVRARAQLSAILSSLVDQQRPYLSTPIRSVKIVGFSKGCVIPSGILFEWGKSEVDEILYIDPGASAPGVVFPPGVSPTGENSIQVYLSPRQVLDPRRPWLHSEAVDFCDRYNAERIYIFDDFYSPHDVNKMLDLHFSSIPRALGASELEAMRYFF